MTDAQGRGAAGTGARRPRYWLIASPIHDYAAAIFVEADGLDPVSAVSSRAWGKFGWQATTAGVRATAARTRSS